MNFKKIFLLLIITIFGISLNACKEGDNIKPDNVTQEKLDAIVAGIIIDTDFKMLANDLVLPSKANGEYPICWSIPEKYSQNARIEVSEKGEQKIVVTRPNFGGAFAEYELIATISVNGISSTRVWKGWIKPQTGGENMSCVEFLSAKNQTIATISGIVTFTVPNRGYWIKDDTASVYVYANGPFDVRVGDFVTVSGTKTTYYSLVELINPSIENKNVGNIKYDYNENAINSSVSEINNLASNLQDYSGNYKFEVISSYGQFYKLNGIVLTNKNSEINYAWTLASVNTGETIYFYDYVMEEGMLEKLSELEGKQVEVVCMLWDIYSSGYARMVPILSTIKEIDSVVVTDAIKVANTKTELKSALEGKKIDTDIDLYTSNQYTGLSIVWKSSNKNVLSAEGKVGTSSNSTEKVILTAVIKAGDVEETLEIEVFVTFLQRITISEVINACDEGDKHVKFNAKIIALDEDKYFYAADETGIIYVRSKLTEEYNVGDNVQIVGNAGVYNGSMKQYTRQVVVEKIEKIKTEVKVLESINVEIDDLCVYEEIDDKLSDAIVASIKTNEIYGKLITISGYITLRGTYNNAYIAKENNIKSDAILVYYKSADQSLIKSYEGKFVTVTCVIYDYNATDGWRLGSVIDIVEGE